MPDPEYTSMEHVEKTVRELLTEMKDTSEVIVDLAYAALLYNSEDMAEKVNELEKEMTNLKYAIRFKVLMASRNKRDAQQLSGLLQVASAADIISDAAVDIVNLLSLPLERRPFVSAMLSESDEKIRATKVKPESSMVGYTIGKLGVEACTGCRIIAMKNRQGWTYDPDDDIKIRAGDDVIIRGSDDGYKHLVEYTTGSKPWEFPEVSEDEEETTPQEEAASINEPEEEEEN
ncbi:TrkA-C domain protein [Candidatus Methanoplasma termitum]|uniref:TrkA-C domain protein n=1 Tax=Candidatus Methanoplasma termitum TaxID=1577791 RepID=A0A0A7LC69_9ARCH|nr:TrkA C-terminal domain-containing protein [Candidatus Methanoplasma termitum]AIZ56790.1 TrkA-C domain protein [Candidatus Methanoplasma termitum]MCL2333915.1 potassium transporter TrkA [Candidatus Methanoplasma sp.]